MALPNVIVELKIAPADVPALIFVAPRVIAADAPVATDTLAVIAAEMDWERAAPTDAAAAPKNVVAPRLIDASHRGFAAVDPAHVAAPSGVDAEAVAFTEKAPDSKAAPSVTATSNVIVGIGADPAARTAPSDV